VELLLFGEVRSGLLKSNRRWRCLKSRRRLRSQ
jgi:hypothetical protein